MGSFLNALFLILTDIPWYQLYLQRCPYLSWLPHLTSRTYSSLLFQRHILGLHHLVSLPHFLPPSMKLGNDLCLTASVVAVQTSQLITPANELDTNVISNTDSVPVMSSLVPHPSFIQTRPLSPIKSSITFPFGSVRNLSQAVLHLHISPINCHH